MQFSLFEWASRKPLENVDLTFEWLYYSQKNCLFKNQNAPVSTQVR